MPHNNKEFKSNYMKVKHYVSIEKTSNQGHLFLRTLSSFGKVRLRTDFARLGHIYPNIFLFKISMYPENVHYQQQPHLIKTNIFNNNRIVL